MTTKTEGKVLATMNARYVSRLVGAAFVVVTAVAASNCADQREPECTVAPAYSFSTRLVEVGSASGDCAEEAVPELLPDDPATPDVDESENTPRDVLIARARAQFLNGLKAPLQIGIFGPRPFVVLGSDGYADFDIPQNVAIQHSLMGDLLADAAGRLETVDPLTPIYGSGQFTTPRPQNDICTVPAFSPAVLSLPEIPPRDPVPPDPEDEEDEGDPGDLGQPAVEISGTWTNWRVLVTAGYPGVQFQGTYEFTVNGCRRTYTGTGVFGQIASDPTVGSFTCEGSNPDPDDPEGDPIPNGQPDPAQCDPLYTGMNPDFPVICDPVLLTCLLPENAGFPAIAAP